MVDDIDKLVFEESLLVSYGFGFSHCSVQLLALSVDIDRLFFKKATPGFLGFVSFLLFFVLEFVEIFVSKEPFFDMEVSFFNPFRILLGFFFGVQKRDSVVVELNKNQITLLIISLLAFIAYLSF